MTARRVLVLGGARSGKSREAERLASASGLPVTVVVTAQAGDSEMVERIERHRADRPPHWTTIEAPHDLAATLERLPDSDVIILDCLTLWLANIMLAGLDIDQECTRLAGSIRNLTGRLVIVSNETGLGIVPATVLGRSFRDAQGRLNQTVAQACDGVVMMVAGLPLLLKPAPLQNALRLG